MQKNSQNFSIKDAMQLANSPAGQQLMAYLKENNPDQLKTAMDQAAAGQHQALAKTLSALMQSPQAQALLAQLGGDHG